ncbi:hypothetical protein PUN28_010767 [Cardiocondyla obscurior]|uniref:Uncharacterized protein n=1 Tax=Cardiocondyla obscurior TaxID=286306 RepID=A0AAW2FJ50_9HYME
MDVLYSAGASRKYRRCGSNLFSSLKIYFKWYCQQKKNYFIIILYRVSEIKCQNIKHFNFFLNNVREFYKPIHFCLQF